MIWIEPSKRERKGNYSIDQYYRDNMKLSGSSGPPKPKVVRPPKQVHINDFQFYPPRLVELQNREYDVHLKNQNYVVPVREPEEGETKEDVEKEKEEEQERINNGKLPRTFYHSKLTPTAVPLTEEETAEKETLAGEGFPDWQRRHFQNFIKGLEKYGRDSLDKVAMDIMDKEEDEVREYAAVFFDRYKELKG